ncbi:orexin receptor type 2-like [Haliotis asinina]|uniref:orexin receptor type 2-like n=1 Tax=Haliotis asinina TaxID=109174 RepID=UPI003531DF44
MSCELFRLNVSGLNLSSEEAERMVWELENNEAKQKLGAILSIGIVLLVGFLGNILVCVVYHLKFPPSTSKYFIMTLAIFDLLSCTIALPGEIIDLRFDYHFNIPTLCRIMRFTITLSTCASVVLLVAIAVDRYRKICRPFENQMSFKETKLWIGLAIGLALSLALPTVLLYGQKTGTIAGFETTDCSFDQKYRHTLFPKVYLGITGTLCLLSFVLLIVLYVFIVTKVWKQRQKRKRMQMQNLKGSLPVTSSSSSLADAKKKGQLAVKVVEAELPENGSAFDLRLLNPEVKQRSKLQQKQTIKTTVMLFLVTLVFIISFIPHFALQILSIVSPGYLINIHCSQAALVAFKLFLRSYFINCASNPIIYSFCNPKFRTECKTLLGRLFCTSSCCNNANEQ